MDYPAWVDQVMKSFARKWRASDSNARLVGLDSHDLVREFAPSPILPEAIGDALADLEHMGLLERRGRIDFRLTQEGRKFPDASLESAWKQVFAIHIDAEQERFLGKLVELSVDEQESCARLREVHAQEVLDALGMPWEHEQIGWAYEVVASLRDISLVFEQRALGGNIRAWPSYLGVVRATKAEPHEWQELVRDAIAEWETTNVDFKRELDLTRDGAKAEFVRDMLALANTKSSGRRFLIIGFDDKSREFALSLDPSVNQERLEQILHSWAEPCPTVKLVRVPWSDGTIGVLEIFRNGSELPYLATKATGKLKSRVVYVRHGSHTEPASEAEYQSLVEEAERARNG